jgi:hypothetical protein
MLIIGHLFYSIIAATMFHDAVATKPIFKADVPPAHVVVLESVPQAVPHYIQTINPYSS